MSDAAYSGFYGGNQLHLLPLSHPHPHSHTHPHPHPHQDLSLSTPVHSLEQDSNFGGFFDDELVIGAGAGPPSTSATNANASGTSVWLPDGGIRSPDAPGDSQPNPGIPFVQIHTTDLQQPEKSFRNNAFRRRTAEIKSEAELIKSELAEAAAKERLNATPTPPTRNSSCASVEGKALVQDGPPLILRCPNCPFLSLCQVRLQQHLHLANCFGVLEQQRRQCPGCSNIFYSSDALSLHLSLDHQMEESEALALLSGKPQAKRQAQMPGQSRPKSRIFIKSVDCLREPLPDFPPLMPDGGPTGNILDLLEGVAVGASPSEQTMPPAPAANAAPPPQKPSQKISIKSVDVLREPALLPFDFQLQNHPLVTDNSLLEAAVVGLEPEKPRQPKIYIRNVDILKEPMVLPSALPGMGFNGSIPAAVDPGQVGLAVGADGDVFQADTLLTPTCPLPGFEPSLAPLAQMCSEAFPFDSVLNGNGAAVSGLDNTRFSALDLDFGVDFVADEATPPPPPPLPPPHPLSDPLATMEPQPVQLEHYLPPPAAPISNKQKIFIKNVDILKAPQRGTLHLRTVDELNLMNRTEVEHLIVPNLEPMAMAMMELPPVEQPPLEMDARQLDAGQPQPLGELQPSIGDSWNGEDGYDLAEDLECWPWMEEAVPEAGLGLSTPSEVEGLPPAAEDLLVKDFFPPPEESHTQGTGAAVGGGAVPPLVAVSSSGGSTPLAQSAPLCSLPVPPLVPLAAEATAAPAEKPARIYVANNLLPAAVEPPLLGGGTSVRGRPYGAKHSGGTASKRKLPQGSGNQAPEGGKCLVEGCMFRFKSPATLEYHGRCHNTQSSSQPMVCPECRSTEFSNWNCLHTHLWRTHQIDMELYCCQLCSFKTPIYSRLVNTHAKIHSEERNYKCEQCGKGFKNTKQLKNHRRLHRTQGLGMGKQAQEQQDVAHRCEDCGAAFKQKKSLREHLCKERNEQLECPECQRVFGSKSSLRLHLRSHQEQKRFRCDVCEHETSDHNAFRRHLATHKERKRYSCPHCDFRAIQSTAFRIHLQKRHPEQELSSIIYKCEQCSFTSINQGLLQVHQAKHEASAIVAPVAPAAVPVASQSQIKVESSLLLAHSSTNAAQEVLLDEADVLQAS
ncbi:methyl-CpG-binding domain protein 6 [Drosophila ficusphila]|uniref:methyl-CpG-binding domain protein 6 n=1 Tax=Drosophila ficusphila TaxID=30025 RepID=UPI0007E6EC1F|nr:methyl-CpG-binding domain protein 6 [Drosophila ficusphila]